MDSVRDGTLISVLSANDALLSEIPAESACATSCSHGIT